MLKITGLSILATMAALLAMLILLEPADIDVATLQKMTFECPLRSTGTAGEELPGHRRPWRPFVSNPELAPQIKIGESKSGCQFKIAKEPVAPYSAVDWRIGQVFADPTPFLGRKIDAGLILSADAPITLTTGSFYVYDGLQVHEVGVKALDSQKANPRLAFTIPPGAKTLEVWLRLTLHGGIQGKGTILLKDATLSVSNRGKWT